MVPSEGSFGSALAFFVTVWQGTFGFYDGEWALKLVDGDTPLGGRPEVMMNGEWKPFCDEYINPEVAMVICRELGFSPLNITMKNESHSNNQAGFLRCDGDETSLLAECSWAVYPSDVLCQSSQGMTCNGNIRLTDGQNLTQGNVQIYRSGQWAGICDHQPRASTAKVICRQMGFDSDEAVLYMGSYFGAGVAGSRRIECNGREDSHEDCSYIAVADPALCTEDTNLAVDCNGGEQIYSYLFTGIYNYNEYVGGNTYQIVVVNVGGMPGFWCDNVTGATEAELQQMKNIAAVVCASDGFSRHNPQISSVWNKGNYDSPLLSIHTMMCTGLEDKLSQCVRRGTWLTGAYTCDSDIRVTMKCNEYIRLANGTSSSNGRLEIKDGATGIWLPVQAIVPDPAFAKVACRQLGFEGNTAAVRHGDSFGLSLHEFQDMSFDFNHTWSSAYFSWSPIANAAGWPLVYTCAGSEYQIQDCQQDQISEVDDTWGYIGLECDAPAIEVMLANYPQWTETGARLPDTTAGDLLLVRSGSDWRPVCLQDTTVLDAPTVGVLCHSLGYSRFRAGYVTIPLATDDVGRFADDDILMRMVCKGTESNVTECSLDVGQLQGTDGHQAACDRAVVLQCQETGTCPSAPFTPETKEIDCYNYCLSSQCPPKIDIVPCSLDGGGGCMVEKMYYRSGFNRDFVQAFGYCKANCSQEYALSSGQYRTAECCYTDRCNNPDTALMRDDLRVKLVSSSIPSSGAVQVSVAGTWKFLSLDDRAVPEPFLRAVCWQAGYSGGNIAMSKGKSIGKNKSISILDYDNCDTVGTTSCPHADVRAAGTVMSLDCNARSPPTRLADGGVASMGRLEIMMDGVWGTVCSKGFTQGAADVVCKNLGYPGGCSVSSTEEPQMVRFRYGKGTIHLSKLLCQGDELNIRFCEMEFYRKKSGCTHADDVGIICEEGSLQQDGDVRIDEVLPVTTTENYTDVTTTNIPADSQDESNRPLVCAVGTCTGTGCTLTKTKSSFCSSTDKSPSFCYTERRKTLTGNMVFKFGCSLRECITGVSKTVNNEDVTRFCCTSAMCNVNINLNITDVVANANVNATLNFTDVGVFDATEIFDRNATDNLTIIDVINVASNVHGMYALYGLIMTLIILFSIS